MIPPCPPPSGTSENEYDGNSGLSDSNLTLVPTGEYVNVKYLMVDDSEETSDMTIRDIWSSEDNAVHVLTQQPGVAEIYACEERPDWYFVYATPTVQNGVGNRIIDASAALDDVNGQAIDGVVYDPDSGIAMIPASAIENDGGKRMQLQFLQLVTLSDELTTHARIDVSVSSSRFDIAELVNSDQQISADAFDRLIDVPVFAESGQSVSETVTLASSLALNDFEVFFDGMRVRIDDDTAVYDEQRGVLSLGYSPVGISHIAVVIHSPSDFVSELIDLAMGTEDADAAYVISDGDISFFNNGRTFLDKISPSQLSPGAAYTYTASMRASIGTSTGGIYGKAAGYHNKEGANEDFAQQIRDGASWEQIRASRGQWHTTYGTGYDVVEAEGPWNKSFGGLDWHTIGAGSAGTFGLDCSHIDSAAGNSPHKYGQWFTGTMFMRILRVVDNGQWSYVIAGFQSPNIHNGIDSLGRYFNQPGSGLYKIRLASAGKVKVQKTSKGNSELGVGKGSSVSGCVFGLYEDAATTRLFDKATTNSSGTLTFLVEPNVTYYLKELSAPWPHDVNSTVYTVNVSSGATKTISVQDDTTSVLQISKMKRPQNGTYSVNDVAYPESSSKSRLSANATVSGQNNAVSYSARINARGTDCSTVRFEVPREIVPTSNGMSVTCNDGGQSAGITRNGQTIIVSGMMDGHDYTVSFSGTVKRGWSSSETRARLLTVNSDSSTSKKPIDARLSSASMAGAQYTIYVDEACTIEAGDYDLSTYPTQIAEFRIYESLNNNDAISVSSSPLDKKVAPSWRAVPLSTGGAAFVSTSSNLALDWGTATETTPFRTCKLGASAAQHLRISRTAPERAVIYLGTSSMIFDASGMALPYSADEAAVWNQTWHIKKISGTSTITIGSNGIGKWGNARGQYLLPGKTYYVKETKAPSGYDMDTTVHKVTANANGIVNLDVTDTYTTIELRKQTRYPSFVSSASRYEIGGAKYGLYDKEPNIAGSVPIATMVTDSNGIARVDHLKAGTRYYVKELSASKGLLLDGETHVCDVKAGTLNVVNLTEEIPVKVQISKRSSDFVPNIEAYSLAGAQFALYTSEADAKNKRNPARIIETGSDGNTPNETVPMRDYWIREIKAPYGYHLSDEIQTITAREFQESSSQSRVFEDAPRDIEIQLTKTTDPLTKAEGFFSSLAGAEFGIYATMNDAQNEANPMMTVVTDKDGKASLASLSPSEYYFVRETIPPANYVKNESIFTVHVTDKLEIAREVYDDGVPVDISIVKSSRDASVLNSNYSLAGATFGIYTSELDALNRTNPVKEVITDVNGKCPTVTGLHARDYWVSEVAPPNGFYLEADPVHVRFPSSASATASFAEDPIYGYIRIQKLSDDPYATPDVNSSLFSYQNMKVAVFDTYQKAASAAVGSSAGSLFTMTTDAKGFAVSTIPLVPGDYYLREIAAPTGYEITRKVIHTKAVPQASKNSMSAASLQLASVNGMECEPVSSDTGWNGVAEEQAPTGSLPEMFRVEATTGQSEETSKDVDDAIVDDVHESDEELETSNVADNALMANGDSANDSPLSNMGALKTPELPPTGGDFAIISELARDDGSDEEGRMAPPFIPDAPAVADFTLSYDLNSGVSESDSGLDREYVIHSDPTKESKFIISDSIPTREGWRFCGWVTRVPERCNLSPLIVEPGQELDHLAFESEQNPEEWGDLTRSLASYATQDGENKIVLTAIWLNEETDEADTGSIEIHKMSAMTSATTTTSLWSYRRGNARWLYQSSSTPSATSGGWTREGKVCDVPTKSNTPIYEVRHPLGNNYHYTTSAVERNNLVNGEGWTYIGIKGYSDDAGGTPVRRYYLQDDCAHYFTTSTSVPGWTNEGIGFYGIARFAISYSGNGATSGSTASQTRLQYGIAYSLRANGFAKTGYHFLHWNTGTTPAGNYGAGASYKNASTNHTATVTMTAQWAANTYTIKFNGNGATGGSTANLTMTYNAAKNLTANGFTRTGYSFAGWATSANGAVAYANKASVKNLTSTHGGTVNLYAKWTERPYYVKFDANGGTGTMPNQKFLVDVAQRLSANKFTKANCTFVGWSKTKPYGNVRVVKAQYGNQASVKNLTSQNGTITLYAVWRSTLTPDTTATTVYDPPKKTSIQIDKVISGFVPAIDFDSTHSLAGATFGIYNTSADASANKNAVATVTTDKYGHASWDGAQVGATYYVKETKAPSNGRYNVDASVKSAKVSVEGTPASLTFTESLKTTLTGTLKIAKRISGDNVASKAGIGGTWSVNGCTFGIYATAANAQNKINPIQVVTVPASGDVTVSLMPGTYYVREMKAAENLGIDGSVKNVTITANATATVTFADPKRTMGISVNKVNSSPELTAAIPGNHYSLEGAVFGVYASEADAHAGNAELASMTTDTDGKASLTGLYPRRYYIKEIQAPPGFEISQKVYAVEPSSTGTVSISVPNTPVTALVSLKKSSDCPDLEKWASRLSLAGAQYDVFADEAMTDKVASLTTDENGNTSKASLYPAKYWIRESVAPAGHELNDSVYEADLSSGGDTVVEVSDHAPMGTLFLEKTSNHPEWLDGDLSGAVFGIFADSECEDAVSQITTDENGHAASGWLPIGRYYVKENVPLVGHAPDDKAYAVDVEDGVNVAVNGRQSIPNETSSIILHKNGTGDLQDELGLSLADAVYGIYATPECSGDPIERLVTDGSGLAHANLISPGTYWICEETAPDGYAIDEEIHEVVVDGSSQAEVHVSESPSTTEMRMRIKKVNAETGVAGGRAASSCEGALFEISFFPTAFDGDGIPTRTWKLRTRDDGWASLDAASLEPGSDELYLDKNGNAVFPDGKIIVREVEAPAGYEPDDEPKEFFAEGGLVFDAEGTSYAEEMSVAFADDPIRCNLTVKKIDGDGNPIEGVPFALSLLGDDGQPIETHVLVSNENGMVTSECGNGENANANDGLLFIHEEKGNGSISILEEREPLLGETLEILDISSLDHEAGVWFSGGDGTVAFAEGRGRLVPGEYVLTEVACDANDSYALAEPARFTVSGDTDVKLDDIVNVAPRVAWTNAKDRTTQSKFGTSMGTHVDDLVHYENLTPGEEYVLSGTMCDTETGQTLLNDEWVPLTIVVPFVPKNSEGELTMSYDTGAFDVTGKTMSINLKLSHENLDKQVHNVLLDDAQETIHFPEISTSAKDAVTGKRYGLRDSDDGVIRIVDTVSYSNLEPGKAYTMTGGLHATAQKASGADSEETEDGGAISYEDAGTIMDADGNAIAPLVEFVPESAEGSIDVEFEIPASSLGKFTRFTVSESLTNEDGIEVAAHDDMNDEKQSVYYPTISTTASDKATSSHLGTLDMGFGSITDAIEISGFPTDAGDYTLNMGLVYADDGEPVVNADGTALSGTKTVSHTEGMLSVNGSMQMESIPEDALRGRAVTVTERLSDANGNVIARHAVPGDVSQTVWYPAMDTVATDAKTGMHVGLVSGEDTVSVSDEVTVFPLPPEGVDSELALSFSASMHGKDGGTIRDDDAEVTGSIECTLGELVGNGGKATATLTAHSQSVSGKQIVIYETMASGSAWVCAHEDPDDPDQSVAYPSIDTVAGGYDVNGTDDDGKVRDAGHDVPSNRETALYDDVEIVGLRPGVSYEIRGQFLDAEGSVISSGFKKLEKVETFDSVGDGIRMRLAFDPIDAFGLMGGNGVCVEELYAISDDGSKVLVGIHDDMDDADQTVRFIPSTDAFDVPATGFGGIAWGLLLVGGGCVLGAVVLLKFYRNRKHGGA